ncbi:flagellar filament capping protein FliD [Sporosalibacterium faouarense]|uniref:flagellar filament capping protein FliD n=1 Tax=Sporosalibacterium faouarense TaxID=516123 RepID=UPI00141C22E4|nr:flagellar filament capping protein FliD [Sporosalibacterium faouarense]MTI46789.1 hypothetical protein [Bacillota bacterium]
MSDMLRITGMATGMDTESIIKQLMSVEYSRVDSVKQKKEYVEWQTDAYREMTNLLRGFKDEYFNMLNPSTNMMSSSTFAAFSTSTQVGGIDSNVVTVKATGSANVGTHTINNIKLAQKALWSSSSSVSDVMTGNAINFSNLKEGKSFNITLDGNTKTITLNSTAAGATTATGLATELQSLVNDAFGSGSIDISGNDGTGTLSFQASGHTLNIESASHTYLSDLGLNQNQTNSITGQELDFSSAIDISGNIKIDVNGTEKDVSIGITGASTIGSFVTQLQTDLDVALGNNVVEVVNDGDRVKLVSYNTSDEITILSGDTPNSIGDIGFASGQKINKLEGNVNLTASDLGKEMDIFADGTQYHIDLTQDYTDIASLTSAINSQLSSQGATFTVSDGGSGNLILSGTAGQEIKVANSTETVVDDLGFDNISKNVIDLKLSLNDLNFGTDTVFNSGKVEFQINDTNFSFDETDSLQYVINQINSSDAGVTLSYSSVSDKFVLQADNEGAMNDISLGDLNGTNFLNGSLNLNQVTEGTDAQFTLDGVATTRSSNNFTIDGVEYTLNTEYDPNDTEGLTDISVNVNADPDEVFDTVKKFVDKYNEVISEINSKLTEEKFYDYKPLTEVQKGEMSEKEIELWEEKAKSGMLRSDSILRSIVSDMRNALYDGVDNVGIRLFDIGITTSSNYRDRGKLIINEDKLKEALSNNSQEIMQLFTNKGDMYGEKGIASKLNDIIDKNISTTRGDDELKGRLLEKAGIEGDTSAVNNILFSKIQNYDEMINGLQSDLADKEEYYYSMFARLETAMAEMNSQSSWLASQFGGGM